MQIDMSRFRDTFFEECAEHLSDMELGLMQLEKSPQDDELCNKIFRAAHSIKGASGTVGFPDVAEFTHGMESLLDVVRGGQIRPTPDLVELLLRAVDTLRSLVGAAKGDRSPPQETARLQAEMKRILLRAGQEEPAVPASAGYDITFVPSASIFRQGQDPLLILRELAGLGEIVAVEVDPRSLPPLAEMDPESCYLGWRLRLRTPSPLEAIRNVFVFLDGDSRVEIEPIRSGCSSPMPLSAAGPAAHDPAADPLLFGNYLIRRGLVTAAELDTALSRQEQSELVFGHIAVLRGKLTAAQGVEILEYMKTHPLRFGEAAVSLGHLTEREVRWILKIQRDSWSMLGELLVDMGVLTRDVLETELAAFEQAKTSPLPAEDALEKPPVDPKGADETPQIFDHLDMMGDFVIEAREHLESGEQHLLALEHDPTQRVSLDALYRAFHTPALSRSLFGLRPGAAEARG